MTATDKIKAVQTLFAEQTKTVYNGFVAVDSSLGMGRLKFNASATEPNPTAPFSVSVQFIFNGIVSDAISPNERSLMELWFASGSTPNFGYDFSESEFFAAQTSGGFSGNPNSIVAATLATILPGTVNTIIFKTSPASSGAASVEIKLNGQKVLNTTLYPANITSNGVYLVFKGVDISALSVKAFYQTGQLIVSGKGENSLASPFWTEQTAAFSPSAEPIVIQQSDPVEEAKISLYLEMAAQKILARLYGFYPEKTTADIPSIWDMTQVELAVRLMARAGAEGEVSHNENGINRSYRTADDEDILSRIKPYTRAW